MTDNVEMGTVELITSIMAASAEANFKTMDRLYENERQTRQALEMLISDVLYRLDFAYMGSPREYEIAVEPLRRGVYSRLSELAQAHPENDAL